MPDSKDKKPDPRATPEEARKEGKPIIDVSADRWAARFGFNEYISRLQRDMGFYASPAVERVLRVGHLLSGEAGAAAFGVSGAYDGSDIRVEGIGVDWVVGRSTGYESEALFYEGEPEKLLRFVVATDVSP